jgi:hypothetical protein
MPLPTVVIAGAQKCGTSTLAVLLRRHPRVFMSKPKELHFFDRHFKRGLDWYEQQFTPGPRHLHYGEGTPTYLYDDRARRRMTATLPDAKLVVILRNPTARAYSHYWHSTRWGHEDLDFAQALAAEKERLERGTRRERAHYSYADRGHYIDQLLTLTGEHSRELLHVMLLEDLVSDRVKALEGLFEFLEINPGPAKTIKEEWANRHRVEDPEGGKPKPVAYSPMDLEIKAQLVETFRRSNDRLAAWLQRDLSAWNKV